MVSTVHPLNTTLDAIRPLAPRGFVGASRIRLWVMAGDTAQTNLPPILRQLNYVEATSLLQDGGPGGPTDMRDVCLIDEALEDAFEICESLPKTTAKILMSSTTSFVLRRQCADAGIHAVIADPVDPRELADWLEHFDDRGSQSQAAVLVVDDDELAAECIAALLLERGIEAEVVSDPTRVFEALDRCSFDLILMDLDMPEVNGIDLARMIRLDRRHLSVPIVFLSAGGDTETQMRARHWGGDDFISKRTDQRLLTRLVELRVERARVLRTLIERDGLTGLIDHRRFVERIGQELARSNRTRAPTTLAMLDIDHFKAINDRWGHQTGDLVLRRLATSLTSWLRRTDVIGRYGGEEFGILMLDTPPEHATPVIDAFRRHFAELDFVGPGGTFRATLSGGIAGAEAGMDTAAMVAAADAALYRAKTEGRNRTVVAGHAPPPRGAPLSGLSPSAGFASVSDHTSSIGEAP